jgi:uncharacterized protein with NAD-binding domain and iron-sulfur cluster
VTVEAERPTKVAIVGGGCAGIAAAWELTRPEQQGRFQVSLYQQGWRLGGKGASGRGPSGRIEEHGLHLWLGYYENAFRLIRECYAELDRPPSSPMATWEQAFSPVPVVGVTESGYASGWDIWLAQFPPNGRLPGDPDPGPIYAPAGYVEALLGVAATLVTSALPAVRGSSAFLASPLVLLAGLLTQAAEGTRSLLRHPQGKIDMRTLDASLAALSAMARAAVQPLIDREPGVRRIWEIVDVALGNARGMVADGLLDDPRGFDSINHLDYRDWLRRHGVAEGSLHSPVVRGLYDLGFAYEDGDPRRPQFAAGQALRCAMRTFFSYKGSVFWRMNAGMGDAVFAPFYEVLRRRGVDFEFFHRLREVGISDAGGPHVCSLSFDVQATPRAAVYEPLMDVRGLPSWPARPDITQLVEGNEIAEANPDLESQTDPWRVATRDLRVGKDFDMVVLAVGFGAVPHVCKQLIERDERWRVMAARVKAVATQAFQLWLRATPEALGWQAHGGAVSGFVEPFDTCADMSHLLEIEDWSSPPRSIAYFCSTLDERAATSERPDDAVRAEAVRFLEDDVRHIWPGAVDAGGRFCWDLLAPPGEDASDAFEHPFDSQYWRANTRPSDRYVMAFPGTMDCRISPLDPTYDNLTVAGDWTDCGFNCGCVEAAVMSGRLAAHALSRYPPLEEITGYDHP